MKSETKLDLLPTKLLSRDKKSNQLVQNQFYRAQIKKERNKINAIMHSFQPGYLEAE